MLAECRVVKSVAELQLMAYVSWLSSMAHVEVMRDCKPGMLEYQLEARLPLPPHNRSPYNRYLTMASPAMAVLTVATRIYIRRAFSSTLPTTVARAIARTRAICVKNVTACSPVQRTLQPCVVEAATLCSGRCNPMYVRCICACGPSSAVLHYGHAGASSDQG